MDILRTFNEVTVEISAEKFVTLSKSAVLARMMIDQTKLKQQSSDSLPPIVKKLVDELHSGLVKRFGDRESNDLIAEAIFLDPRFKKQGFSDQAMFNETYQALLQVMQQNCTATDEEQQPEPQPSAAKSSIWEQFDETISKLQTTQDPRTACIMELDKYIAEPYLSRHGDPLDWWNSRKHVYPNLYRIMLTRLCIIATSVPCERIFSKTGQLISERRSALSPKNVAKIMFLNVNLT
ncbi:zinc finger BED domain-containing protein 4-like [Toxorhynchites rutilus septentrionalis]|uniref:zinc finger BED domain-containing protein 4-like n=1 Tax=Toxorhynchites rutilus septentrionalis TaxID=329112 RepID=UPI0024784E84|nr:zinc finger BED domain-containing protein 4-like [Toxorhynchites rutilus septentrionalis]